jgi:fatty-acid desaturase
MKFPYIQIRETFILILFYYAIQNNGVGVGGYRFKSHSLLQFK